MVREPRADQRREFSMPSKIVVATCLTTLATLVGVTAADAAPRHHRSSASEFNLAGTGNYKDERFAHMYDRFGLPYSNTARHDPRDTNGN
jgi:hypothetical protein